MLSVAAAYLTLGAVAQAQGEPETGAFNEFRVKGTHGYSLLVWAFSREDYRQGEVILFAARGRRSVIYQAPARVTDTKVDADLGVLGEVHVTFQPSGKVGVARPRCDSDTRIAYEKGAYVGTIDFRGEEGFTRASAKRAAFTYHPLIDIFDCAHSGTSTTFGGDLPGAQLEAGGRGPGEVITAQVNQNRPRARVRMGVRIVEQHGEIRVTREVEAVYRGGAFHFAPDLSTAYLAPPAPFAGSARYRANAKPANSWTGSLTVDFPGHSNVSLTGAQFRAHLRHAKLTKETFYPERRSRLNLAPLP